MDPVAPTERPELFWPWPLAEKVVLPRVFHSFWDIRIDFLAGGPLRKMLFPHWLLIVCSWFRGIHFWQAVHPVLLNVFEVLNEFCHRGDTDEVTVKGAKSGGGVESRKTWVVEFTRSRKSGFART